MERKSKFMDWDFQYYIDFILPKLIYVIPIICLHILGRTSQIEYKIHIEIETAKRSHGV